MSELGYFQLGTQVVGAIALTDFSDAPVEPDANPTYRVYGNGELMNNGTGSLSQLDTGTISAASNAVPIVITSANHGLQTGNRVTITGVQGNGAANGTWQVTRIDANTFSLISSAGNGAYTSGGQWHSTGLWQLSLTANAGDNYAPGQIYSVLVNYLVGGLPLAKVVTFGVV